MDTFAEPGAGKKGAAVTKTRREFPPEFKRETVALLESSGRPLMQVANEVGISPSMLRNWRAAFHGVPQSRATNSGPSPMASSADQAAQIVRLKRDLERTRMERDVLKKRMARPVCKGDFEAGV